MKQYELVIFDMDGTLYRFESSGTDDAIFGTRFYDEIKENGIKFIANALSVGEEKAERMLKEISAEYKDDVSIALEKKYRIGRNRYFEDVWNVDAGKYICTDGRLGDLLKAIQIKKALLTSAPRVWAKNVLEQLAVDDLFDCLWFGDGDIRKPDKRAYLQVTSSLNIMPEKTVMVEDEPKYLKPAKELGMTTVLVGSETNPWANYCIPSIYEIQNVLGGL